MDHIENEIKEIEKRKAADQDELEGFRELADAFDHFSTGFMKMARFFRGGFPHLEERIRWHNERINELKQELEESQK